MFPLMYPSNQVLKKYLIIFGIFIPVKGEQEPVARIPGHPRVLISINWQKGLNPAIQPLKFFLQWVLKQWFHPTQL